MAATHATDRITNPYWLDISNDNNINIQAVRLISHHHRKAQI